MKRPSRTGAVRRKTARLSLLLQGACYRGFSLLSEKCEPYDPCDVGVFARAPGSALRRGVSSPGHFISLRIGRLSASHNVALPPNCELEASHLIHKHVEHRMAPRAEGIDGVAALIALRGPSRDESICRQNHQGIANLTPLQRQKSDAARLNPARKLADASRLIVDCSEH